MTVSSEFRRRWKSGTHTATAQGDWRPRQRVFVRRGEYRRGYHAWSAPLRADITGESRNRPWQATWMPAEEWTEIPGVSAISLDSDFDVNGTTTGTIAVENILYRQKTGNLGELYHVIEQGALSPMRGYKAPGLKALKPPKANEWYGVLTENAQIKVYQGYGDALEPTFIGFIDKVTPSTNPDVLTLAVRCIAGKVLNDEHIFGWNVSKQLPQPVIFRQDTRKGTRLGYDPQASSALPGHPARFAVDTSTKTEWLSATRGDADNLEWIEVRLKRGTYSSFVLQTSYAGMEVYVGIYAKARLGTSHGGSTEVLPTVDGHDVQPGWLGDDDTPGGTDGGWSYVRRYNSHGDDQRIHQLPATYEVGDDSILRVGFRRLKKVGSGSYRAGVVRLQAIKDPPPKKATKKDPAKFVSVHDPADIIRVVLRWAGFKEWKIEDTGAEIDGDFKVNRESTYMDVIQKVLDIVGSFVFYVEPPTDDDDSLGTPVFRESNVLKDRVPDTRIIRDTDLLTDIDVNLTDDPKSYIIRVRGRAAKHGLTIGKSESVAGRTLMAVYRPPWSARRRMSRIIRRHAIMAEPKIKTQLGCETAARLIAFKQALQGATASIDIPGTPEFELDAQVGLADTATGTATRLYIVSSSSQATYGQNASWMTTLGGSLIDHIDVVQVKQDLDELYGGRTIGDMAALL